MCTSCGVTTSAASGLHATGFHAQQQQVVVEHVANASGTFVCVCNRRSEDIRGVQMDVDIGTARARDGLMINTSSGLCADFDMYRFFRYQ